MPLAAKILASVAALLLGVMTAFATRKKGF